MLEPQLETMCYLIRHSLRILCNLRSSHRRAFMLLPHRADKISARSASTSQSALTPKKATTSNFFPPVGLASLCRSSYNHLTSTTIPINIMGNKSAVKAMAEPNATPSPPTDILGQIAIALNQLGYAKTAKALTKEAQTNGLTLDAVAGAQESALIQLWEGASKGEVVEADSDVDMEESSEESETEGKKAGVVDDEAEVTSDDGIEEESESEAESSEEEEEDVVEAPVATTGSSKRKRAATPDSSSSEESAASDGESSSSESSSEEEARPAKRTKIVAAAQEAESSAASSSAESSESEAEVDAAEVALPTSASSSDVSSSSESEADSDSSDSGSESDDESSAASSSSDDDSASDSDSSVPAPTPKKKPVGKKAAAALRAEPPVTKAAESSAEEKASESASIASTSSSATLAAVSPPPQISKSAAKRLKKKNVAATAPTISAPAVAAPIDMLVPVASTPASGAQTPIDNSSIHPSRLSRIPNSAPTSSLPTTSTPIPATEENIKKLKKDNVPFQRIPADTKVDPRFASNEYQSYEYADRAFQDLSVTRGKGFTKEKNKKKRGEF